MPLNVVSKKWMPNSVDEKEDGVDFKRKATGTLL